MKEYSQIKLERKVKELEERIIQLEKSCETCKHFYECDNMGHYEECLPSMEDYESKEV